MCSHLLGRVFTLCEFNIWTCPFQELLEKNRRDHDGANQVSEDLKLSGAAVF